MGSSCFSRGNKKNVLTLQNFLKEKGITHKILLKGAHCMGECDKGPVVKVGEQVYYHINEERLEELLNTLES